MEDSNILEQFQGFLKTGDIFHPENQGQFRSFDFPEIKITDSLIADLEKLDHPRNSVLGKRMESFFQIAIQHSSRYDILASNLQIIQHKRTLGELDFILFDKEISKPIHVELVYKLYVYDLTFPEEPQRWIGPNRRDSFNEKLEKLRSKQFPLIFKPETGHYLKNLGIDINELEQQLCFKAQLYLPAEQEFKGQNIVNPYCISGNWYTLQQFKKQNWQNNEFYCPPKKDWSREPTQNKIWWNKDSLENNLAIHFGKNKAPLVWMRSKSDYHKFFIVWW